MARRGEKLREHILYSAKSVFLEMGFERASMDVIAARAETSKRTLYAHFENKEKLYLSFIDLARGLFLSKLKTPGDYSTDREEALVMFCGRYLEGLLFIWTVRMCRLSVAEAERFPQGAAQYFDAIFSAPQARLSAYLTETCGMPAPASAQAAQELLGQLIYPRFSRALFGVDAPREQVDDEAIGADFDLEPVRKAVAALLESQKGVFANTTNPTKTDVCKHELSDADWERVLPLLPPQRPKTGRPALDHRQVVNGILWVLDSGEPWRDLPARYGSWRTAYSRWRRWRDAGVWDTVRNTLSFTTPEKNSL